MPTAEAQIHTPRASRYLAQLCRHASQMGRPMRHRLRTHDRGDAPPEVQHVEWSDTYGIVSLTWGQWTMQATPDTLTLRAEPPTRTTCGGSKISSPDASAGSADATTWRSTATARRA